MTPELQTTLAAAEGIAAKDLATQVQWLTSLDAALGTLGASGEDAALDVRAALGAIIDYSQTRDLAVLKERLETFLLSALHKLATALSVDLLKLGERGAARDWAKLAVALSNT